MQPIKCHYCEKEILPGELVARLRHYVSANAFRRMGGYWIVPVCGDCVEWADPDDPYSAKKKPDHFEPCEGCGRPLFDIRKAEYEENRKRDFFAPYPPIHHVCSDACGQRARRNDQKLYLKCDVRCQHCDQVFIPKRTDAKYCSSKCRVAAHRAKKKP